MYLIQLATPEQAEFLPPITHIRLVNEKREVNRPIEGRLGHRDLWFAKGFIADGIFREAPGYEGINIHVNEIETEDINAHITEGGKTIYEEEDVILYNFALENGYIEGQLVNV